MLSIDGYEIRERIHEGVKSFVYRAVRQADGLPVVLKLLRSEFPSAGDAIQMRREFEALRRAAAARGVIGAHALESAGHRPVLVLEDFGAASLAAWMAGEGRGASLEARLRIAIAIADSLGQLHERDVVHKDLNPSNVLWAPAQAVLKLCDLGLSTVLSRESPEVCSPADIEGTLPYVSPEQTGRMNRPVDYRTDFYSLGATLYELFTGRLPFERRDPLELVHCHLAMRAEPPSSVDPAIPEPLSGVVMRLLAKTAEERYQSTFGIKADLEECLARLRATGEVASFDLAQRDTAERFEVPRRLYGRDAELASLLSAFESAATAGARASLALVAGAAGIGKSALVHELYKPITARRGYFTAGKFDQLQRTTPYSAFGAAFRSLVRQVLGESETALAAWRTELVAALGANGGVVTEVVPELSLVIGDQPPPTELGPTELQNRFGIVFRSFLRVFARPEHPLTLFLDDLQWADPASLKLIDLLLRDDEPQCLLIVGACRDNEVGPAHPLSVMLGALARDGVEPTRIALAPLASVDVTRMVADATGRTEEEVAPLAALVASKTEGNPLFVSEMLKSVYQDGLLTLDRGNGTWRWDLRDIEARGITDNVVDLMIGKLKKLPDSAQRMLKLAAFIGSSFDVDTLSVIAETMPGEAFELLLPAIQAGFVNASSGAAPLAAEPGAGRAPELRFLHDRVQQAAYALVADDERGALHLRIGRLLLAGPGRAERLFAAVDHLDRGRALLATPAARRELAQLNLDAGRRATRALAYGAARTYLEVALECLPENGWDDDYDLTVAIHEALAAAASLDGAHDRSEALLKVLVERCRTAVEKADAHILLVSQYTMLARYDEALAAAKRGAALLGMDLPVDDSPEQIQAALGAAFGEVMERLGGRAIPSLASLPEMTDPAAGTLVALLQSVLATAFFKSPLLYGLIIFKAVRILLEFGPTPRSPEFFVYHGHTVSGVIGDPVSGYQFGRLALDLSERFAMPDMKCRSSFILANFISPWTRHLRESRELNEAGFRAGLEGGELQFAGYILIYTLYNRFYEGRPLDEILAELPEFLGFTRKTANHIATDIIVGLQIVLANLRDAATPVREFRTADADDAAYLAGCAARKSSMALAFYPILKAEALYLHDEPRAALEVLEASEPLVAAIMGNVATAFHPLWTAMSMLALWDEADRAERARYREKIDAIRAQFEKLAAHSPSNFAHLASLLAAEIARVEGRTADAAALYEDAIDRATNAGFAQHAALACELAGALHLRRGRERAARAYLSEALHGWQIRGSHRKVAIMRSRWAEVLEVSSTVAAASASSRHPESHTSSLPASRATQFDVASIVKATQAISGEIVLDRLLTRVMHVVLENAGAEKGALLVQEGGELFVQVDARVAAGVGTPIVGVQRSAIGDYEDASEEIVRYVARTRESVVLRDATKEPAFARSPYVVRRSPRSVLCAPIVNHGELLGVLYLENNLTAGAFTSDRVDFLGMLSAQAAISLQNARLYESLKARNEELARTHQSTRRFVPEEYLKLLGHESITDIRRGDQTQLDVSVLFSDIRGFTTISERLGPAETFRFVNEYLACVEPEIHGNFGLVNQYYGDGVMALFPASADDALRAAAGMFRALARFRAAEVARGVSPIEIGVGVNSGLVTLGTIGGGDHLACTVMGDTVNLASRVEGITRLFGASVLAADETIERLREPSSFALRPVGRVLPKGKTRPVTIFEALDAEPPEKRERRVAQVGAFRDGLALWQRGDFRAARDVFRDVLERDPADRAARMYLGECERRAASPTPDGWDGVFRLDTK